MHKRLMPLGKNTNALDIAARGAMGDPVKEASRNYHIPISNTAAATVLMTTEHALAPA